jgi:hypothetical protein
LPWWRASSPIRSDRRYGFEATREEMWALMADVGRYRSRWPWLRRFEAPQGLVEGAVWRCRVQPPLPYSVRFTVTLDEVVELDRIRATIGGDIEGSAGLTLRDDPRGCELDLVSSLAPRHPGLRALAVVGRPLIRFGHDWVLDTGAKQFDPAAEVQVRGEGDR